MSRLESQTLLIDADDTLWENNIYFEAAIADFITYLDHKQHTPQQVRHVLNDAERECVVKHGYGIHSFANALVDTFERLATGAVSAEKHEKIRSFAHAIAERPMEIMAEVAETLEYLAKRHRLMMVTKGNATEQAAKVERSGLKGHFSAVEIVPEKHAQAYLGLVEKYALAPESTWMVGNSPKSDINPAMAAGLNAVFVPHGQTWVLEHEEVCPAEGCRLLVVERFMDLREHF